MVVLKVVMFEYALRFDICLPPKMAISVEFRGTNVDRIRPEKTSFGTLMTCQYGSDSCALEIDEAPALCSTCI